MSATTREGARLERDRRTYPETFRVFVDGELVEETPWEGRAIRILEAHLGPGERYDRGQGEVLYSADWLSDG